MSYEVAGSKRRGNALPQGIEGPAKEMLRARASQEILEMNLFYGAQLVNKP